MTELTGLGNRIKDLVRAGFSGIWVETHEIDDAIAEINDIAAARNWTFDVWDIHNKLYSGTHQCPGPVQILQTFTSEMDSGNNAHILVLKNFHRFLPNPEVVQTLANAVVRGKQVGKHIVILAPTVALQPEIEKLFTIVNHDLPTVDELKDICTRLIESNDVAKPDDDAVADAVDAARGLTRLEAENAFALSLTSAKSLVPEIIWNLKATTLSKTGSLSLYSGNASFADLGGLDGLKTFCVRALKKQGCEDQKLRPKGVLLLSPPGCGKSQFSKALGNEVGRPTIVLDFGSLMGKFVGESEGNMRRALQQVDAMAPCILFVDEIEKGLAGVGSSGQTDSGVSARLFGTLLTWLNDHTSDVFFIGTCNDASQIPAPFARAERFDGVFFVDLPSDEQRKQIWDIYIAEYELDKTMTLPDDTDWTGAEIKACCRLAALLEITLEEASLHVVPIAVTSQEDVANLRTWASGRCLSASEPGIYGKKKVCEPSSRNRKLETNGV